MRKFVAVTCISAIACLAFVTQATSARSGSTSVGAISPAAERSSTASQLAAMQKRIAALEASSKTYGATSAAHGKLLRTLKSDLAEVRQFAYWPALGEVGELKNQVLESLAMVACTVDGADTTSYGTAFAEESLGAPDAAQDIANGYKGYMLTAYHVISDCDSGAGVIEIFDLKSSRWTQAQMYSADPDNDVASLMVKVDLPGLKPASEKPVQGSFVMGVGFGSDYAIDRRQPRIATGSVIAVEDTELISDEAKTQGFSGGPIVDWNGDWVGLIQYGESWHTTGGSLTPRAMCIKLYDCASDDKWLRW